MPAALLDRRDDRFGSLLGDRRGSGRADAKRTDATILPYHLKTTPSRIARMVAGQLWPDVQRQRKLAAGLFGFTCAGHGGIIAVIGVAELDPVHVQAARDAGLTHLIVKAGAKTYSTHAGYARADLENLIAQRSDCEYAEVWAGEEDCDWATILYQHPALLDGAIRGGYLAAHVTAADIDRAVATDAEHFLAALYPDYKPVPNGQLDRQHAAANR